MRAELEELILRWNRNPDLSGQDCAAELEALLTRHNDKADDPRVSTTVTLRLSVRTQLEELARERRTSMAALIALAVDRFLAEIEKPRLATRKERSCQTS